jgi:hypothetical protein
LERSWPDEYARTERIETQPAEQAKESAIRVFYDAGNSTLRELLDFPNLETDSPGVIAAKQAKLLGLGHAPKTESEPAVSDPPPPKVVTNKALTGRIHPSWKGNGK